MEDKREVEEELWGNEEDGEKEGEDRRLEKKRGSQSSQKRLQKANLEDGPKLSSLA